MFLDLILFKGYSYYIRIVFFFYFSNDSLLKTCHPIQLAVKVPCIPTEAGPDCHNPNERKIRDRTLKQGYRYTRSGRLHLSAKRKRPGNGNLKKYNEKRYDLNF